LARVLLFLLSLWLVKDNAVNIDLGFIEYPRGPHVTSVTSNFRAVRYSTADGSFESIEFRDSEARNARDIFGRLFGKEVINRDEYHGWVMSEDFNRLNRVFVSVQSARASSELGTKIARYVTCLETLFCTDASEMAHKLAERVAFFVGNSGTERVTIFKQVKAAYNVRSKVVHGDKISRKLSDQASDLVRNCDELLRKSLYKILITPGLAEIFSAPPPALENYFTNMIIGDGAARALDDGDSRA
jgi:hypothetical protein